MNDELIKMLKYLHLGGLLENWDTYLEAARKSNFSHVRLLQHIIEQEYMLRLDLTDPTNPRITDKK